MTPRSISRRFAVGGGLALFASPVLAQHAGHGPVYERLNQPGRIDVPALAAEQRVFDSIAPKAPQQGRWIERAPLPLPRTEMAWAAERNGKLHLVGGYAEQRVDKPYHHIYDAGSNSWLQAQDLPLGANHVGVAVLDGRLYAMGGFIDQNRRPHAECFVYGAEGERWSKIAPLPTPMGAMGCIAYEGRIHAVGGADGDTADSRLSRSQHIVYDPKTDKWSNAAPLPTARDHIGIVANAGLIHVIGGRVNSFYTNSHLHHTYDAKEDAWRMRNPLPTARSGHGATLYRGQIFCMGGEGSNRVFGQNEAYNPTTDKWLAYAPMATPRHGMGAVTIGDAIYVAGGGPVMGGGVKSAVHEAFTLA
ncbi:MAG: galactose oxidase [Magnetospirillum sp.]|nr:galactose oxidase [Magnetospirillum sp.]